jgi:acetyltransferase-like isoleucine patch superfamily enzyme
MNKVIRRIKTIFWEIVNFKLKIVGYIPSHFIRRFFYRVYGVSIGAGSTIHMGAVFYYSPNIKIGKDTIICENIML